MADGNRFRSLRRVLERREAAAQRALTARREALEDERSRQAHLETLAEEYRERFDSSSRAGLHIQAFRLWRQFSTSLGEALAAQSQQLSQREQQRDAAQEQWMAARRKHLGGEKLEAAEREARQIAERRLERRQGARPLANESEPDG